MHITFASLTNWSNNNQQMYLQVKNNVHFLLQPSTAWHTTASRRSFWACLISSQLSPQDVTNVQNCRYCMKGWRMAHFFGVMCYCCRGYMLFCHGKYLNNKYFAPTEVNLVKADPGGKTSFLFFFFLFLFFYRMPVSEGGNASEFSFAMFYECVKYRLYEVLDSCLLLLTFCT